MSALSSSSLARPCAENPEAGGSVEVCIVAFGSEHIIGDAVRSVALIPNSSVAVCDNSRDGASVDVACRAADEVNVAFRSLRAPQNPGFGVSCNSLAESSQANWLVFLNPDAIVTAWPWDSAGPPRARVLGALQSTSSGRPLQAYGNRYGIGDEIKRSWLRRASPRPNGAGFVGGGAMAIERTRFVEIGKFDSRYFLFYEDIDLCLRANDHGLPVFVAADWTVQHDLGHSARKNLRAALVTSYHSGRTFHHSRKHNLRAYDFYVLLDSAMRLAFSACKRDRAGKDAYRCLMRSSAGYLSSRTRNGPDA